MKQPTHFIEVWKDIDGSPMEMTLCMIRLKDFSLGMTKLVGGTTIAVWKIYPKK